MSNITDIHRQAIAYHDELNRRGYDPIRCPELPVHEQRGRAALCHVMWLCLDLSRFAPDPTSIEQEVDAMTQIAFIRGVLWSCGIVDLDGNLQAGL
ncbi:MAG: hypothetical protein GWN58_32815 [Anaerolineae bacterium]|nr:hypothetical protein [Thermoplasmata archaeon]NIV34058.1 hypothetical protein [Anaerolineae bacterium]NIY05909.1 hypothetical protein [Thermoplasmata archaeon]